MRTWSAWPLTTPLATTPTPFSLTSFTDTLEGWEEREEEREEDREEERGRRRRGLGRGRNHQPCRVCERQQHNQMMGVLAWFCCHKGCLGLLHGQQPLHCPWP
jgi:hypothetical protein